MSKRAVDDQDVEVGHSIKSIGEEEDRSSKRLSQKIMEEVLDWTDENAWKEFVEIGGETVYGFLQQKAPLPSRILALITVAVQIFVYWFFLYEAINCGFGNTDDCTLATSGGVLSIQTNETTGKSVIELASNVTPVGISLGLIISLIFLLPDFVKGATFFRRGYSIIGLVHVGISLLGIASSGMYTITTATSDVQIITNVVVILFISDLDEHMYRLHDAAAAFYKSF